MSGKETDLGLSQTGESFASLGAATSATAVTEEESEPDSPKVVKKPKVQGSEDF